MFLVIQVRRVQYIYSINFRHVGILLYKLCNSPCLSMVYRYFWNFKNKFSFGIFCLFYRLNFDFFLKWLRVYNSQLKYCNSQLKYFDFVTKKHFLILYVGNAGDKMSYNNGFQFTTRDRDNDSHPSLQCAHYHHGSWWYGSCTYVSLNGDYSVQSGKETIHWNKGIRYVKPKWWLVRKPKICSNWFDDFYSTMIQEFQFWFINFETVLLFINCYYFLLYYSIMAYILIGC